MNFQQNIWRLTVDSPSLHDGEIHVWRADLTRKSFSHENFWETLSPDEQEKAEKYRFAEDRRLFTAARGVLRKILSGYLGAAPGEIRFSYNRFGKPALAETGENLRFNLSHARDAVLVAVARGREVGVDIELIKSDFTLLKTAESFFSEKEIEAFKALPSEVQLAVFFSVWTRKEAYLKAIGQGFSYPPKRFSVSLSAERVEFVSDDSLQNRLWSLFALPFESDYQAALAVEGAISQIRLWQY